MNARDDRHLVGQPVSHLETPSLLVDLRAMERNLQTMAHFFQQRPAKLRPHFKNHRVLELASVQIKHGAIGLTCARVWQAASLIDAGVQDILIANELAGENSLASFVELSSQAPVILAVDNSGAVQELARLSRNRKTDVHVVVDIDLGLKRCGVAPGAAGVALAKSVVERGLKFRGIMGYEGHLQPLPPGPEKEAVVKAAMRALLETKSQIRAAGIAVEIVSCGGTGDYSISGAFPGVTESQAGSYLLMDSWYAPFAPDFTPTLSVLATIISKTPGERIVADAGAKALSGERGLPSVKNLKGLKLRALHAEHAPIDFMDSDVAVKVGDKIEIVVHYHDATIQLHHKMYGVRDGKVERVYTIEHAQ
jgi:D-serine deaminase-like pyridoxal phosphate-dependent protein